MGGTNARRLADEVEAYLDILGKLGLVIVKKIVIDITM